MTAKKPSDIIVSGARKVLEFITPELATEWLAKSVGNRPIMNSQVDRLVREIKAGRWNPETSEIRLNIEEELIDGHHRLTAIRKSGIGVWQWVAFGCRIDTVRTIDTGVSRTNSGMRESRETDVRALFEQLRHQIEATGPVWVEGTARGVRTSRGNALYFTLRDGDTSAHCRISSTMQRALHRPREGEQLRIRAVPTLFELRGEAQLDVLEVVSKGEAAT